MMTAICDGFSQTCTGCGVCANNCPVSCISMERDTDGFLYPSIDSEACIECESCKRTCPNNKCLSKNAQGCAWAFQEKGEWALRSSSGGAFHALGLQTIQNGGVVYGFALERNGAVVMHRATSEDELMLLQGSKYIQGTMLEAYPLIARDVDAGIPVLVSGTACQIAGIQSLVDKQASNLLLVDVVCHGVPSPELFEQHWGYIEKQYGDTLTSFLFRDKSRTHWLLGKSFRYKFESYPDIAGNWKRDPFYNAYLKGEIMRECCYACPYATPDRCSDITLCDYWRIGKRHPEMDLRRGVSAVVASTKKGADAVQGLVEYGTLSPTELEQVIQGNPNLIHPTKRPPARNASYATVQQEGYASWAKRQVSFADKLSSLVTELIPVGLTELVFKITRRL